ncbi:uncharacterized protein LOC127262921 [Andrographis paniculata]|uniref:uncharacterized protein LOC127262921 n=1 Tax=Andrographis paniculata TaxID=175694 RepID=UPI0021E78CB7|nr:uncharacterized protein LOC127262921 [Andrographis paniculata]
MMNPGGGGNRGGRSRGVRSGGRNFGSRGRSQRSVGRYVVRNSAVGAHSGDAASTSIADSANSQGRDLGTALVDDVTQKFDDTLMSDQQHYSNSETIGVGNISSNPAPKLSVSEPVIGPGYYNEVPAISGEPVLGMKMAQTVQYCGKKEDTCKEGELSERIGSSFQAGQLSEEVQSRNSEETRSKVEYENTPLQSKGLSFDICEVRDKIGVTLKPSMLVKNKAMRNETKRRMQGENIKVFRPGMILLKGFLALKDQVKLVKSCRDLGRKPGGFYQPGYRDGATLHLKMMCLGKHWDPETSTYCDKRSVDEAKPPPIPDEFLGLVKKSIQDCHDYLDARNEGKNSRSVIPSMSPNVCIINFYTRTGRLGLHQDKDESQESIRKGLPVVSFSLGDSAKFLFGDHRDIEKADEVELESGDVLVFGGDSRNIFHGVSSIIPGTAPKGLLEETNLKPGRLNLTFREY